MLDFLKKKILKVMLSNWIKGLLAAFKQKNPKMWAIIAIFLTSAQVVLDKLLADGIIPEGAEWVEWIIWIFGLLLGSGEIAALKFKKELKSGEAKPEKMVHLSAEDKYNKLLQRNQKLEDLIRRA